MCAVRLRDGCFSSGCQPWQVSMLVKSSPPLWHHLHLPSVSWCALSHIQQFLMSHPIVSQELFVWVFPGKCCPVCTPRQYLLPHHWLRSNNCGLWTSTRNSQQDDVPIWLISFTFQRTASKSHSSSRHWFWKTLIFLRRYNSGVSKRPVRNVSISWQHNSQHKDSWTHTPY